MVSTVTVTVSALSVPGTSVRTDVSVPSGGEESSRACPRATPAAKTTSAAAARSASVRRRRRRSFRGRGLWGVVDSTAGVEMERGVLDERDVSGGAEHVIEPAVRLVIGIGELAEREGLADASVQLVDDDADLGMELEKKGTVDRVGLEPAVPLFPLLASVLDGDGAHLGAPDDTGTPRAFMQQVRGQSGSISATIRSPSS